MIKVFLKYDKGSIILSGLGQIPYTVPDPRTKQLRAQALYHSNIISYLQQSGIEYEDDVNEIIPTPQLNVSSNIKLSFRTYQKQAIKNWLGAGKKGSIVLPTGSGKTIIAIKIIELINSSSIIIVPTIDLMDQWTNILSEYFKDVIIGNIGGGIFNLSGITVSTYDSAYLKAPYIGNKFDLIIFDELHHLAAPGYKTIAEQFTSKYRLGLTATYEREDNLHIEFPKLVGGIVFSSQLNELTKAKYLASFVVERRYVKLSGEEKKQYEKNYCLYHIILKKLGINLYGSMGLKKLILMSGKNKYAREALLARNNALDIALNSKSKIEELTKILAENQRLKTIIFTQHNKLVYAISNKFLIPYITYKSSKQERHDVLNGFKGDRYNVVVTSKVLDEGVDIPDAELGIIVSGTGSKKEFIQRLGRLLRTKPDSNKRARLIELISSETHEINISARRKQALKSI